MYSVDNIKLTIIGNENDISILIRLRCADLHVIILFYLIINKLCRKILSAEKVTIVYHD